MPSKMPEVPSNVVQPYSPEISATLDRIYAVMEFEKDSVIGERLVNAVHSFGPSCLYDSFQNVDQVKGALFVLEWLESYIKQP